MPGGFTPSFQGKILRNQDWALGVHGFILVPLRIGFSERVDPTPEQSKVVLHAPPRVPGDFESFDYTSVVPNPWVQLNLSFDYKFVTATVIIAARTVSTGSSYFNPPDTLGINDAFLTFKFPLGDRLKLTFNAGAFSNSYGNMGEYDLGRYGTPLIARLAGTGVTGAGLLSLGDVDVIVEAGFQGQFTKVPIGVEPAGWNGFADPNVGTTWGAHVHAAVDYRRWAQLGAHYIKAFSNDDRATPQAQPDGDIQVFGTDLRLDLSRFGHLNAAYSFTQATTARSVSDLIRVLNAPGGKGLMDEYLDPNGNGSGQLHTVGAQYDFSLGNLLRYPQHFQGDGPDLVVSLFTIFTHAVRQSDTVDKVKYGAEVGYSPFAWLAVSGRWDRVQAALGDNTRNQSILSARVILHSGWNSQDQVVLQYSHWFNGSGTVVKDGYPPAIDPTIVPDADMISVTGAMWF